MNFVELLLQHTKYYESPQSFWRWSAYTAIGAVLRDNCYRKQGDNYLYPNIYTLFLADSAVHRKGAPVKLCETLVAKIKNTKVISGRSSIQAILDELSRGETDKKTGKIIAGGSALFSAAELSAGIVNDPEAIKILTDIYDFKDEYVSRLRGAGIFRIKNLCFSMVAASNEDLLRDVYDTKAIFGGLLGRTFLIKPNEFRKGNSLLKPPEDQTTSLEILGEKLKIISQMAGEFTITGGAEVEYEEWYYPFRDSYKNKPDKSGIVGRIHTGVLKLAMILCANETQGLEIQKNHIEEAIALCMALLPNYSTFIMASGKSTVSTVAAILIEDIWKSKEKQISKRDLLARHFHEFDLEDLEACVSTLEQAGLLKSGQGVNTMIYSLTPMCVEKFGLKEEKS